MSECDCFSNAVDASNVNQFYMHQDFPIVVILVLREQKTQTIRGYINFYLWKHIQDFRVRMSVIANSKPAIKQLMRVFFITETVDVFLRQF